MAPTDTRKYLDDSIKVTKTTVEFGPLKIYRVPAVPSNDFGRNGDLAIIDDTAVPMTAIATDVVPTNNDLCQKQGGVWVCGLGGGAGGPAFGTITTDAGSLSATVPGDTAPIVGGPGISTAVVAGQVVVTNTSNIFGTVTAPAGGNITASGLNDTLNLVAGTNMTIVNTPGTNTVTFTAAGGVGIPGLSVVDINGQPTLVLEDTTRANKKLSIAEQPLMWSENVLNNDDWIRIGNANDADDGYVMDFDGTLVYATAHCENTNGNSKDINLWVNGVFVLTIGTLTGAVGSNVQFVNTLLNYDFNQGDKIQLRAQDPGLSGNILDTVVKLTVKWRG